MKSEFFIFVVKLLLTFSLSKGSFLNISSMSGTNSSNEIPDQDTSDTQNVALTEFGMDLFNNADAGSAVLAGDILLNPSSDLSGSDLKVWEAIPVVESHSQMAQYLQPPSSQLIDLSSLNAYDQAIGPSLYDDAGTGELDEELHSLSKPSLNNNWWGGDQKGVLGGLKTPFPRLKLRKLLKRQNRQHALLRKPKTYGSYYGDVESYLGNFAQLSNSFYQPFIPKFTPFPINFPNFPSFGSVGSRSNELELFKSILVPLAGVALMGATATAMLVTNPFIWSLPFSLLVGPSTFGHIFGRRRRRNAEPGTDNKHDFNVMSDVVKRKIEEIKVLDNFLEKTSKAEAIIQEKKVLATYLMTQTICLDRLVCSLHRPNLPEIMVQESRVMTIVTKEILGNEFVPQIIHDNILRARQVGLANGNCQTFLCQPVNYWAHHGR